MERPQRWPALTGAQGGLRLSGTILTGEDALYYEALTDGADGAILLAHIETATFAAVRTLLKEGKPD